MEEKMQRGPVCFFFFVSSSGVLFFAITGNIFKMLI